MRLPIVSAFLLTLLASPPTSAGPSANDIVLSSGVQGGLIVHLGCGDGQLTGSLRIGDAFLVHGLDVDPTTVDQARTHIGSLTREGQVSADVFDGRHLPYADNLVNLILVSDAHDVSRDELLRVLAPGGVAISIPPSSFLADPLKKPRPQEIDEWTRYLHGPDNNAVAEDTVVGPPRYHQWISGPHISRSHDHLASVSAVMSAAGRLFSIVDQGSIAFAGASPRWRLVARGEFNGIRLWEREISSWEYHLRDFRSGPPEIARRLKAMLNDWRAQVEAKIPEPNPDYKP